jgi:NAD(P)-dependent dehydrogenase (short-subunit alcohol dehydrogenase family)
MANKFEGKVALMTGGSTGIGSAAAKRFVQEGMDHVFITGRRKDVLDPAVVEIGRNVTAVQGDVASLSDLDRLYEAVKKQNRKIDVIFANAGIAQMATFGTVDEEFYDLHFDANVKGLFFMVQKGLPLMTDGGAIILTASIASIKGFSRHLRLQRHQGSRPLLRTYLGQRSEGAPHSRKRDQPWTYRHADFRQLAARRCAGQDEGRSAKSVPLGRMGDPHEIAKAASVPRV